MKKDHIELKRATSGERKRIVEFPEEKPNPKEHMAMLREAERQMTSD